MIYLVFNEGYSQGDPKREAAAFSDEAIRLGRLLLRIFPGEPEIMGLLALMLLQISRRNARFDANGELVLLEDQDRSRWNHALINEALNLLDKAIRHHRPGPYQLQAAIAAIHSRAKRADDTDWEEIDLLYRVLERLQPSPVVTLNRAVAISKLKGPEEALRLVETLGEKLDGYFYYHGLRGGLLKQMGRAREAREAFDRAIALANSAAEAAHIRLQIDKLQSEPAHPVAK
jgi:RNA polymerase sigma-70 factor (ECF subfamily)